MEYDQLLEKHIGAFDHWCVTPVKQFTNCSKRSRMDFSIPKVDKGSTGTYSKCMYFVRNYSELTAVDVCGKESNHTDGSETVQPETQSCQNWYFDESAAKETIIAEWSLVCSKAYMAGHAGSLFMVGKLVANLVAGPITDRWGRRKTMMVSGILTNVVCIGCAFSPNYHLFFFFRFLMGVFITSRGFTLFAYAMEFCGIKQREVASTILNANWTVGYMMLPLIAYFIRPWRWLQLVLSIPDVPMTIIYFFAIPESPRWLLANGKQDEAHAIIHDMARVNKVVLPGNVNVRVTKQSHKVSNMPYLALVRNPGLRWLTLNCMFIWLACSMSYYGFSFNTSSLLTGDPYTNCLLSAAVEVFSWPYILLTLPRFGRRRPYIVSMLSAGVALLVTAALPQDLDWLYITISMIGKAMISTAFLISWFYVYEIYPTTLKATALHVNGMSSRIGASVGAYMGLLGNISSILPFLLFGSLSLIAGTLVLALPETSDATVKQTTEDGEKFIRENSCSCCGNQKPNDDTPQSEKCLDKSPDKSPEDVESKTTV